MHDCEVAAGLGAGGRLGSREMIPETVVPAAVEVSILGAEAAFRPEERIGGTLSPLRPKLSPAAGKP